MSAQARSELLLELQSRIRGLETAGRNPRGVRVLSSGFEKLDRLLPGGGFSGGTLIEWLGSGSLTLALTVGGRLVREGGALAMLSDRRTPFPPGLAGLGVPLDRVIVVRPGDRRLLLWAWEQSLRCEAITATIGRLTESSDTVMRRLQLAVEAGGGIGFLIRSAEDETETMWSECRLLVRGLPSRDDSGVWRLGVELLRSRGGAAGGTVELEVGREGMETNDVSVAAELGSAAGSSGRGGSGDRVV